MKGMGLKYKYTYTKHFLDLPQSNHEQFPKLVIEMAMFQNYSDG